MTPWHIRDITTEDLEAVVQLDDASTTTEQRPVFALADVVAAITDRHPAVLAIADGVVVGSAVSRVDRAQAWVLRLALAPQWRNRGLGSDLLSELEHRLLASGVRRISALLPDGETGSAAFANSGFRARLGLTHFEKVETVSPRAAALLARLGGVVPPAALWGQIAGMAEARTLIERRIVLPLARPELAAEHGVVPPRAVVLFGPPGTGKTTFARAVAGRLGWPFIELFPSRLAAAEGGLASGLNVTFGELAELDNAVVFIDEVEEIAAARDGGTAATGVVNELLKGLVTFRERAGRLLICATNTVSALDPAFLRHGRFDYVLPIGPPDRVARHAQWERAIDNRHPDTPPLDLDELAAQTDGFTPADIAHAARTVAQRTFERTIDTGRRCHPSDAEFLAVITAMRPTLTAPMLASFTADIEAFART
ncbi:MAG TPA: bifunctional GNAT family N-acetyltransferase/ATP-binding protein [Sporichthya sp.]|nr:bifunctional GNAT family N-acetyltransferase/ATP-binding protein [Sporichthya sp.]